MKFNFFFPILILTASICAYAEEPDTVSGPFYDDIVAVSTIRTAGIGRVGEAADQDESCRCWCTAQGILLRECGGETENLGNFGNIQNCNKHLEIHPQCN